MPFRSQRRIDLTRMTQAEVEKVVYDSYWEGVRDTCGLVFTGTLVLLAIWGGRVRST